MINCEKYSYVTGGGLMTNTVINACVWPQVKLGDHVDLLTGFPFKSVDYIEDQTGIRLLRGDNVAQGYLRWDGVKRWPVNRIAEVTGFELREGDVILSMDRPWIEAGLKHARVRASDLPVLLVQRVARLRGRGNLYTGYLLYLIGSLSFTNYIKLITTGTAVPHISAENIATYEFPLPPLPIQHKIANILSTWDRAIDLTTQLIMAKQQYKQGLMQQLLTGKRRFQEFRNTSWHSLKAGDIFQPYSARNNGTEMLLSVTQERGVLPRSMLDTRVAMPSGEMTSYKLIEPGNFIISLRSFQGGIEYSEYRGLVSPAYTVLKSKLPIVDSFYKHLFKSQNFISHLGVAIIGIRDGKQINFDDFASIRLAYPIPDEQQRIAEVLDTCDNELKLLHHKLALLKKQKQGLMQQLLTGKVRVKT
jgi:type I restriction enzyme, S subunit